MPGNVNAFFREDHPTLAYASTFPRSGPKAVAPSGAGNSACGAAAAAHR